MLVLGMISACTIDKPLPADTAECKSVSDCYAECRTAIDCVTGQCQFSDNPDGQASANQLPGDCVVRVCNGQGGVKKEPDPTDIPDDDNVCTLDICTGPMPEHKPLMEVVCYPGPPETKNVGSCKEGVIHCNGQGKFPPECEGAVLPAPETCATAVDDDCDGLINEEGSQCTCVPGSTTACYTGTSETLGIGACHEGTQTCLPGGTGYGPCTGDQLPTPENCDAAKIDEDCDGLVNEEGDKCHCGDGTVQADSGEDCDDGNADPTDSCVSCQAAKCGDGYVQMALGEECDDGNMDSLDACTTTCLVTRCGDGVVQPKKGEGCDDGNLMDGDACPADCQPHVIKVAAGAMHTCALFEDGRVKCWGGNALGQLGLGDTQVRGAVADQMGNALPVVDLGGAVVSLAAGSMHTCALFDDGRVKCWGANAFGQLGLGDTNARGDGPAEMGAALPSVNLGASALAVTAGSAHSCALLISGSVKCWGYGFFGQLGQGSRDNLGALPTDALDVLPAIELGTGRKANAVAAGQYHTCALLDDQTVKCWGSNEFGQLGQNDKTERGDDPGEMGDMLSAIDLGAGSIATLIASGAGHVCAVFNDKSVKCWGAGYFGQLGNGTTNNVGDDVGEMAQLGPVDLGSKNILQVSLGANHTCAKFDNGTLQCFGRGSYGQLGLGSAGWLGTMPGEIAMALPIDLGMNAEVGGFAAGSDHNCAINGQGHIKCWGRNDFGQLGLGDVEARGDEMNEMGDALPFVALW